jgi:hypothetical protein
LSDLLVFLSKQLCNPALELSVCELDPLQSVLSAPSSRKLSFQSKRSVTPVLSPFPEIVASFVVPPELFWESLCDCFVIIDAVPAVFADVYGKHFDDHPNTLSSMFGHGWEIALQAPAGKGESELEKVSFYTEDSAWRGAEEVAMKRNQQEKCNRSGSICRLRFSDGHFETEPLNANRVLRAL